MHPAVERLTEIIPPGAPRRPRDWATAEQQLGTPLPEDYKELVETYGGGVFDETIWLLDPECPDEDYNLLEQATARAEILADLWQTEARPTELQHDAEAQVLPWAYIEESGAYLYWLRRPAQKPGEWTVMLNEGRGPEWEHHAGQCAAFLLSVLTGEADTEYFPELPAESHQFDSNDNILT
ncbi:SMI1/KNR4 family protein [Streptomyces sp. ME02-8801-2C]|uniref:SMI1/KNR4 family protein n=1 Tax=Streptomyces sp. ME02-8801-2C TaxID=3028680 RepID=UPI0029A5EB7A|nr:SMI1/KNR4 family protein [Streptomyces sp. ME02-8801-2C]MDX3453341.1 SMI1/KNR4 family protein [Streptomyces sp. ME02-8801-2C]